MTKPECMGAPLPDTIGWWRNETRPLFVIRGRTDLCELYDKGTATLVPGKYYGPFNSVSEATNYVIPK